MRGVAPHTTSCVSLKTAAVIFPSSNILPTSNIPEAPSFEVTGAFTQSLAARLREGHLERLQISLQGPFGRPRSPRSVEGPPVVYVCGGVGITPCLAESKGRSKGRVRLYWAVRSEALLRRVMESLELDELSCVKLRGRQEADDTG